MGRKIEPDCRHIEVMCVRCAQVSSSPNLKALNRTLRIREDMRQIEEIDAAKIMLLRSLARAVDVYPDNAALWKQYRDALKELSGSDHNGPSTPADLFPEVRDTPAS